MRRSIFVAGAAAAPAVPAIVRAAAPIAVGIAATDVVAPPYYAQQLGYFRSAGLDVELQVLPSGPALAAALAGGAIQIGGVNTGSLALARLHGVPLRAIVPTGIVENGPQGDQLLVAKDSPIRTGADLAGKTIATNALKTAQQAAAMAWVDAHGGDAKSVKFVELVIPAMGAALEAGRVDAGILAEPFTTQALVNNRRLGFTYEALRKPFMIFAMCAADPWLAQNGEPAAKFVAAMRRVNAWANARENERQRREFNRALTKLPAALTDKMVLSPMGTALETALVQPVVDVMFKYGFLEQALNPSEIIWRA